MNHKTAGVEVRECLALGGAPRPPLEIFAGLPACEEVLFLSTCNRVEVLAASPDPKAAAAAIREVWCTVGGGDPGTLDRSLYVHLDEAAVRHLFRVAASLDSMVVGEPQILGQLKEAYRKAAEAKTLGLVLNRLLNRAFSVAKRIRTQTRIASQAVSISYAAVELARKIFGDLSDKRALLIGAGEMAELAARHLLANGVRGLVVANRTLARAADLARELGGEAVGLDELEAALEGADIVISSTGAPGLVIQEEMVRRVMRRRRQRPLFFIDIAVPRDVDPAVNEVDNVYLYDIDDLKGVVEGNKAEREREARKAERMLDLEVLKFQAWLESLDVVPLIRRLQDKGEAIRRRELERSRSALGELTPKQAAALDRLTTSIVQKLLHDPIVTLRRSAGAEEGRELLDAAYRFFNLNGAEPAPDAGGARGKEAAPAGPKGPEGRPRRG
ncbi:glutamyl-tRNA reductase [Dissulfurirhabdus thermomarina]|nr:glutamyl-tRNA reductase [Dissulfurirhabdus thermomarina]